MVAKDLSPVNRTGRKRDDETKPKNPDLAP
jgi:hypothetical protein